LKFIIICFLCFFKLLCKTLEQPKASSLACPHVNHMCFKQHLKLPSKHLTRSQVSGWTHLRVQLCRVAESWDLRVAPDFQHYRGVEGRARSPGIRLGRGTRRSSLNLHPKPTIRGLVRIREHPWVLGQAMGTLTHKTHHSPNSGETTTFPHIVFSALLRGGYIRMTHFPGTPETVPGWTLETLDTHNSWL
jgi:hypothetical protein